jgi:multidrug efflux pump subunit AcrA (membrane-fusion protein)
MLSKKKWITIVITVVALVILVGVIGGVANAQTNAAAAASANTTPADPAKTLYAKVAAILGIDQTKLENAFTQAQKAIRDEQLTSQLKSMVEKGTITQAQADAYLKWSQSRPDVPAQLGFGNEMGMSGEQHGMMGPGGNAPPATSNRNNPR